MKIDGIGTGQAVQRESGISREKGTARSGRFQDILNEEIGDGTAEGRIGAGSLYDMARMSAPSVPCEAWDASIVGSGGESSTDAERAFTLLDGALGSVQQSLERIGSSPQAMEELLGNLSREAEAFQESTQDLPSGHPVKQVGDQLRVLAYVESIKWKRGDYLQ